MTNLQIAILLGGYQIAVSCLERKQRQDVYNLAYRAALERGKPLVVVGGHKGRHGTGHVCVDVNTESCRGAPVIIKADIRDIPLPDKYAGAAFASHVLEHLPTVFDAEIAMKELYRIADRVFIVSPHKWNPIAWLHPDHHLWVTQEGETVTLQRLL